MLGGLLATGCFGGSTASCKIFLPSVTTFLSTSAALKLGLRWAFFLVLFRSRGRSSSLKAENPTGISANGFAPGAL
ncbi:hypothetical protein CH063_14301, partial [Colletotrichum higginsianum]